MRIEADDMSLANAAQLAELGIAAIQAGDASFDLSAVRTCDSSALVVLLAWQRTALVAGRSIGSVRGPGRHVEPGDRLRCR